VEVDWVALGAFLSGTAAVLSSYWALHKLRKAERADCDRRLEEVMRTYREGLEEGRRK
jgi:hypothetical protein